MTFSRINEARLVSIVERMGLWDLEVVQTLSRTRVATGQQLERLHFHGGSTAAERSCRRTLSRLASWRVLARLERRVGGARAGSAGFVYALGIAGQRLAGGGPTGRDGTQRRQPWTPSPHYVAHALAVAELYVRIHEAARVGSLELIEFQAEPRCWRRFAGPGGEVVTLKPDALIRVSTAEFTEHAFAEVDLGTEWRPTLRTKMDRYRAYWSSGQEQHRHGVFPRVLWLVPDRARYDVLIDVMGRQPAEAWQLFKVAEFGDAIEALIGGGDDASAA